MNLTRRSARNYDKRVLFAAAPTGLSDSCRETWFDIHAGNSFKSNMLQN
ncbi:MAG TPA: hypothetical protein VMU18_05870 [Rhodoblastus sp.]|nr:hypothetical protein [Rhodoblastus sp.]